MYSNEYLKNNAVQYGNAATKLKLPEHAAEIYNTTDPLTIWEFTSEGGTSYSMRGVIEADDMTEWDVIDAIRCLAWSDDFDPEEFGDEEFDDPEPVMVESNHGGTTMAKRQYPKADADKLKYLAQYDKENRFTASCKLSRIYDAELIEVWSTLPNKAEWLKQHLREELEKQKAGK